MRQEVENIVELRQQLHDWIEKAGEKELQALHATLQPNEDNWDYTEEFKQELLERSAAMRHGKALTLEEFKEGLTLRKQKRA